MEPRLNYWKAAPALTTAMLDFDKAVSAGGLDASTIHLVKLRASQINGCTFCIDMHSREMRADNQPAAKIALVQAWRESYLFTDREKLALEWTESVTRLGRDRPDDALYGRVVAEYGEHGIAALTMMITVINAWNRIAISFGAVHAAPKEEAA